MIIGAGPCLYGSVATSSTVEKNRFSILVQLKPGRDKFLYKICVFPRRAGASKIRMNNRFYSAVGIRITTVFSSCFELRKKHRSQRKSKAEKPEERVFASRAIAP
jgi:hypothetical protein